MTMGTTLYNPEYSTNLVREMQKFLVEMRVDPLNYETLVYHMECHLLSGIAGFQDDVYEMLKPSIDALYEYESSLPGNKTWIQKVGKQKYMKDMVRSRCNIVLTSPRVIKELLGEGVSPKRMCKRVEDGQAWNTLFDEMLTKAGNKDEQTE